MQDFYYWKQQYELQKNNPFSHPSHPSNSSNPSHPSNPSNSSSLKLCCIGCREPVESIFTMESQKRKSTSHVLPIIHPPHVLRASCGSKTQPCSFHIHVQCSASCSGKDVLIELRDRIHQLEQQLIQYKNDILFGYEHMDVQKYKEILEQLTECRRKQQEWGQRIMNEQGRTLEQQEAYRDASMLFHRNLLSQLKDRMNHIHQGIVESQISEFVQFYRGEIQHSVDELRQARCDQHGQIKEWSQPRFEWNPEDSKTLALSVPLTLQPRPIRHDTTARKNNSHGHNHTHSNLSSKSNTRRVLKTMIRLEE